MLIKESQVKPEYIISKNQKWSYAILGSRCMNSKYNYYKVVDIDKRDKYLIIKRAKK